MNIMEFENFMNEYIYDLFNIFRATYEETRGFIIAKLVAFIDNPDKQLKEMNEYDKQELEILVKIIKIHIDKIMQISIELIDATKELTDKQSDKQSEIAKKYGARIKDYTAKIESLKNILANLDKLEL